MKISDLYTVILPDGSMRTDTREKLRSKYPEREPFPVLTVRHYSGCGFDFWSVDFDSASLGMTVKHFDSREDAERFRDETSELTIDEFRNKYIISPYNYL